MKLYEKIEREIALAQTNFNAMLRIAKELGEISEAWSYNLSGSYFYMFNTKGQEIAHKVALALRITMNRSFDESSGHFDYTGTKDGIEIRIWNAIPKNCKITVVEEKPVTTIYRKYKAVCKEE